MATTASVTVHPAAVEPRTGVFNPGGDSRSLLLHGRAPLLLSRPGSRVLQGRVELANQTYNVLALTKLRRYPDASAELDSLDDDLDSAYYHYESYPQKYPNRSGSMVPFILRWVHAELPIKLGKRLETLDRLYILLSFVRRKFNDSRSKNLTVSSDLWRKREAFVINSIISHHLSQKEFGVCLKLVKDLIDRTDDVKNPNPTLLSKLGP